jgi:quercetin dioxygenase-like cupin family protein
MTPLFRTTAALLVALTSPLALAAEPPRETVTPAFSYPLANVPGKTATAFIVSYPPGATTPPHRHGRAFVMAYVLEGSIRSQVAGGPDRIYKAGESWTEAPGAHHIASSNASATEPAKLIAILIANTGAKDLVVFDPPPKKK